MVIETFFVLVKSYSISPVCFQPTCIMKKALFLRFLRCLLITDLFDNLESGKKIIVSEKSLEKVLNLFPGICAKH